MSKPLIGVCAGFGRQEGGPDDVTQVRLPTNYVDAVAMAGGLPLVLAPCEPLDLAREMIAAVDGVLLTGGPDIDPRRYGREPDSSVVMLDPRRERFDLLVAEVAAQLRKPTLAICLGIQVVNVARRGELIQDLPSQRPDLGRHRGEPGGEDAVHNAFVAPGTLLASIVGAGRIEVNSSHHQAVERPGDGLAVSARAETGLIEAVEDPGLPFYLGVQWHPERLLDRPLHRRLFEALVNAARS